MKRGHIELFIGPMTSGKSTEMMLRVSRYTHAGGQPLIIRFAMDNRYSGGRKGLATSHDQMTMSAISVASDGLCLDKIDGLKEANVVGIDEGQFFNGLANFCDTLASMGKIVIVAALDSTFERKPFQETMNLIPLAEKVVKMHGVCVGCQEDASFSRRLGDNKELIDIGGDDKYICVCRSCFTAPIDQEKLDKRKQSVELILQMRK